MERRERPSDKAMALESIGLFHRYFGDVASGEPTRYLLETHSPEPNQHNISAGLFVFLAQAHAHQVAQPGKHSS